MSREPTHRSTLRCLAERAPALHRAARWPAPLRRWRLPPCADRAVASEALTLASEDDRAFCRRVRLSGWRDVAGAYVAERDQVFFELQDPHGELLWPVALRALILFAGEPADRGQWVLPGEPRPDKTVAVRYTVRVRRLDSSSGDADFEVVVRPTAP